MRIGMDFLQRSMVALRSDAARWDNPGCSKAYTWMNDDREEERGSYTQPQVFIQWEQCLNVHDAVHGITWGAVYVSCGQL